MRASAPIRYFAWRAACPTADVSSIEVKHQAYSLLLSKGLIRIGLPVPATAQFRIASVDDPYGCNTIR